MNISEVGVDDLKMMAQVVNLLQSAEVTLSGREVCAAADTIRWVQNTAVQMSKAYKAATAAPETTAPTPNEGLQITAFSPGKMPRGKKGG